MSSEQPIYERDHLSDTAIVSVIFIPRSDSGTDAALGELSWQQKSQLFFINKKQVASIPGIRFFYLNFSLLIIIFYLNFSLLIIIFLVFIFFGTHIETLILVNMIAIIMCL